jgi:hypothetical protein
MSIGNFSLSPSSPIDLSKTINQKSDEQGDKEDTNTPNDFVIDISLCSGAI